MAHYVDGFVLPVPKKNPAAYARLAKKASRIFRELGASWKRNNHYTSGETSSGLFPDFDAGWKPWKK